MSGRRFKNLSERYVSDRAPTRLASILLLFAAVVPCAAQEAPVREEQEPVKVYTEEVRLPVVAYDGRERIDPTLAADDMLEDGVPLRVRSVRRVPANVLLVFDMGGQVTATRAANATRAAAFRFGARRMGLQPFTLRSVVTAPRRATQDER